MGARPTQWMAFGDASRVVAMSFVLLDYGLIFYNPVNESRCHVIPVDANHYCITPPWIKRGFVKSVRLLVLALARDIHLSAGC